MRRSGLGRGLDALLDAPDAGLERRQRFLEELPIDDIQPNPRQPRKRFDEAALDELASSIAGLGLLQPLLVRRVSVNRYELVTGERRLRAARLAGLERVPVVVVETDERGSLERALVENIHRADLDPIEEAAAYRQLIDEGGLTQEELAQRLGRNRATIANTLRLLDLPTPVQRFLMEGRLTVGHAKALLGLDGNPFMERLAKRVAHEGLSVRETEELVSRYRQMSGPRRAVASETEVPAALVETQRRLADRLQSRVRVDMGKRTGRIVIHFSSLEELERLTGVMLGEGSPADPTRVSP